MFLTLLGLACKNANTQLSIYGETKEIKADSDGWVNFNINFGDFGHTVEVKAYENGKKIDNIFYGYENDCPNENSTKLSGKFLFDHPSQNANIAVKATSNATVQVSVLSAVRPIAINSSICLIYGFFLFFSICIFIAGVLQYFFFKNSMDPREYLPQEGN